MTSSVTRKIIETITTTDTDTLTSSVGLVAIVLLLSLVILRELVQIAHDSASMGTANRGLLVVIAPLLMASGVIIATRVLHLISL